MSSERQKTIERPVEFIGKGLHTGKTTHLRIEPAAPTNGITFSFDYRKQHIFNLSVEAVESLFYATKLIFGNNRLATVEHFFAVINAFEIDNLHINVKGEELPIYDGSALEYVRLFESAGIRIQNAPRRFYKILKPLKISNGDKHFLFEPSDDLIINYRVDYTHHGITAQSLQMKIDKKSFVNRIAPARTFGFLNEIEILRKDGLLKGGELENALVFDQGRLICNELRFSDELVRHKILDCLGDLLLLGSPLSGKVSVEKGGHDLHIKAIRSLLSSRDNFSVTEMNP